MPGDGTPLVILVLAGNKAIFQSQINGAREDIARHFMLTDAAARNVIFKGAFSCTASEPLLGIAASNAKTYLPFAFTCL
jgi:hypothetical protein